MQNYDSLYYPYPSRRHAVFARNGMVATSQSLAAQAGLDILRSGGNAIDAAIATAACLTVVEPTSNGIGGDAFALVWSEGKLHGLNASGPSPGSISIEKLVAAGLKEIPRHGVIPVNVPGIPSAWVALSERFGKLPLTQVLQPAIVYAEKGFPVSPHVHSLWKSSFEMFSKVKGEEFQSWFEVFAPEGRAPHMGEMWRSQGHAETLQSIAETKGEAFYRGYLAEQMDAFMQKHGGFLRKEDLAAYKPEWVDPIKVNYRGYDVWEIPPNGQGLVALMALNILKGFEFPEKDSIDTYHKQIEAMKLAFADGLCYISDPRYMGTSAEALLSDTYAEERRKLISDTARLPEAGRPPAGGTVYLAAADGEGNMISFIQSNYNGFGSGIVIPGTGISLHNRGKDFSMDPSHANALQPGKKAFHTIIPGFLTKDNVPIGPFGVMGAYMQPQGHVQVIMNTIDFALNPQAALDSPRWRWIEKNVVEVEPNFPDHIAQALIRKGHHIVKALNVMPFGRGQLIWRDPQTGVLIGGTEPRADGVVAAW